jgi:hypothetical protein
MRLAKFTLNSLVALLVGTGLMCAQMCDIGCAFHPHITVAADNAKDSRGGHCHQEKEQGQQIPQQPDDSNCVSHSGMIALPQPAPDFAATAQIHVVPVFVEPFWSQAFAFDRLTGISNFNLPFRSPPGSPLLTSLRI